MRSFDKRNIILIIVLIILIIIGILFINYYMENNSYIDVFKEEEENIVIEESNFIQEKESKAEEIEEKIAIHVTGEVQNPGLVYIKKGSRIADAIEAAGGAKEGANLNQVNLAYVLEDGQKIYIPNIDEKVEEDLYIISNSGKNILVEEGKNKNGGMKKVNINSATQSELEKLPGIGEEIAKRIVEYRKNNGNFKKIEEVQNVKGIGDSKYNNIKDNICV